MGRRRERVVQGVLQTGATGAVRGGAQDNQSSFETQVVVQILRMLLTLQDDGVLRVYESVKDAIRNVEALDAEETFRAIFDDTGEVYAVQWIRPNTRGRLFRFMVGNGEYILAPQNRKDVEGLLQLLRENKLVEPQDAEGRLRDLKRRLTT